MAVGEAGDGRREGVKIIEEEFEACLKKRMAGVLLSHDGSDKKAALIFFAMGFNAAAKRLTVAVSESLGLPSPEAEERAYGSGVPRPRN